MFHAIPIRRASVAISVWGTSAVQSRPRCSSASATQAIAQNTPARRPASAGSQERHHGKPRERERGLPLRRRRAHERRGHEHGEHRARRERDAPRPDGGETA